MRTCPNCHTQYTDDSLRYCLQDGTPLVADPSTQQPTASFNSRDQETEQSRNAETSESIETRWAPQSEVTRASGPMKAATPARVGFGLVAAALLVFLLGAVAAIGLWLYFGPPGDVITNSDNGTRSGTQVNINSNGTATPTPRSNPSPSPTFTPEDRNSNGQSPYPENTQPLQVDKEEAASEISQEIRGWISSSESGDLNGIMSRYAPSVDYYRRSGANREFIRADKQRAFRMYDSVTFRVSNMNVSVSDSGETARAVFDKEWLFTGDTRSSGKVQQELQFRRINGEWLITGERDLRVYYTN